MVAQITLIFQKSPYTAPQVSQKTTFAKETTQVEPGIVFVLDNSGDLIVRLLCRNPEFAYNDIAQWHYADLSKGLAVMTGLQLRVTACGEIASRV